MIDGNPAFDLVLLPCGLPSPIKPDCAYLCLSLPPLSCLARFASPSPGWRFGGTSKPFALVNSLQVRALPPWEHFFTIDCGIFLDCQPICLSIRGGTNWTTARQNAGGVAHVLHYFFYLSLRVPAPWHRGWLTFRQERPMNMTAQLNIVRYFQWGHPPNAWTHPPNYSSSRLSLFVPGNPPRLDPSLRPADEITPCCTPRHKSIKQEGTKTIQSKPGFLFIFSPQGFGEKIRPPMDASTNKQLVKFACAITFASCALPLLVYIVQEHRSFHRSRILKIAPCADVDS